LHSGRRTGAIRQIGHAGTGDQKDAVPRAHQLLHGERRSRSAAVGNRQDVVAVEPLARNRRGDVRLVLMIGLQDLDPVALDGSAKLGGSHAGRGHRARSHRRSEWTAHVGQHADADDIGSDLGACARRSCQACRHRGSQ
jgi:hypothetical protein